MKVFVSYRREDRPKVADEIATRLQGKFGSDNVFKDVDSIFPGEKFIDRIRAALTAADVLLVVIGPGWLNASKRPGMRRLDDPDDWVRIEVREALQHDDVKVIPLLVDGATVPTEDDLPHGLKALAYRHARTLRPGDMFNDDLAQFAERLASATAAPVPAGPGPESGGKGNVDVGGERTRRSRRPWLLAAVGAALVLVSAIIYVATDRGTVTIDLKGQDVSVLIDGKPVPGDRAGEPISLRPGKYILQVMSGKIVVETHLFSVSRGGDTPVEVSYKPPPPPSPGSREPAKEITNSLDMKLVLIPAGKFDMGSPDSDSDKDAKSDEKTQLPAGTVYLIQDLEADEKPRHHVRITRPFYLGATEVTRGQFRRFVEAKSYQTEAERDAGGYGWNEEIKMFEQATRYTWRDPGFSQTDEHPVVNVTWNDAQAFLEWLGREEGQEYRLPTEAEWEYACRAGTTTSYQTGNDPEGLVVVGNVADGTAYEKHQDWTTITARDGYVSTAPVGRFRANTWGLLDMHGNVSEWCSDRYDSAYYAISPTDDPTGPQEGTDRAFRGGGWNDLPRAIRSAKRFWSGPDYRGVSMGFRVARSLPDR